MESVKEIVYKYNIAYNSILISYPTDYNLLELEEKDWLCNLEDKTHLLNNDIDEKTINSVIKNLKTQNYLFSEKDTESLSKFTGIINGIVKIANRINNFKEGTSIENGKNLKLYELFNSIKSAKNVKDVDLHLSVNLNSFIPHLFSVIKHCQNPTEYPIYYKYWKNILREVFNKEDDYDSLCLFYRTLPFENRHLKFGCYFGTIGMQIVKELNEREIISSIEDKEYKYLIKKVINIQGICVI